MPSIPNHLTFSCLFEGIPLAECQAFFSCLQPHIISYEKEEMILLSGDTCQEIGIVLKGFLTAWRPRADGTHHLAAYLKPNDLLCDLLSACQQMSPVTITASSPCEILWFSYDALFAPLPFSKVHLEETRLQLLKNLMAFSTKKYFAQMEHLSILFQPTLRAKILSYLSNITPNADGALQIPFTREVLASWLGCERSALCRELSRMAKEGILTVKGRSVWLHTTRRHTP